MLSVRLSVEILDHVLLRSAGLNGHSLNTAKESLCIDGKSHSPRVLR